MPSPERDRSRSRSRSRSKSRSKSRSSSRGSKRRSRRSGSRDRSIDEVVKRSLTSHLNTVLSPIRRQLLHVSQSQTQRESYDHSSALQDMKAKQDELRKLEKESEGLILTQIEQEIKEDSVKAAKVLNATPKLS